MSEDEKYFHNLIIDEDIKIQEYNLMKIILNNLKSNVMNDIEKINYLEKTLKNLYNNNDSKYI
jgi:hypothetical protein